MRTGDSVIHVDAVVEGGGAKWEVKGLDVAGARSPVDPACLAFLATLEVLEVPERKR